MKFEFDHVACTSSTAGGAYIVVHTVKLKDEFEVGDILDDIK